MKIFRYIIVCSLALCALAASAQVESASGVSRRSSKDRGRRKTETTAGGPTITDRMQSFYDVKEPHDADLAWMRTIYRQIDLSKDQNAPLYFPEDVVDGQENLFRLMLNLVVDEKIPAYEYLDGREVFTDKYKINVQEMLDRFGIYYQQGGRGDSRFVIEEADVPTGQVLNYYIIERWEFDKRSNQMKTRVEAICPVLNKYGEYGGEDRYPMFWVKFDQLRPWLAQQYIFLTDDNNLPQYSLDDYFNLGMYQGDIYKTKNLRNLSLMQLYPDPDDLKQAQDSIEKRLRAFGENLWVPDRDAYLASLDKDSKKKGKTDEVAAADESGDEPGVREATAADTPKSTVRSKRKSTKKITKAPKVKSSSSSSGNSPNAAAEKSVRRRRR